MSLLLQALQKAAKNRETGTSVADGAGKEPPPEPELTENTLAGEFSAEVVPVEEKPSEPGLALEEEDLFEPEELVAAPAAAADRFEPFATPSASSAQAATILRASDTQTTGWVDWVRDHPVHTFAGFAGVFAVFYGGYLYLQLFHPAVLRGELWSKPLTATAPPPTMPPLAPAPTNAAGPEAGTAGPGVQAGNSQSTISTVTASQPGPKPVGAGPSAAAPAAAIAGMPQTKTPVKPLRDTQSEAPVRRPEPTPRSYRRSADEPLAQTPALEDHVSNRPADSGRAALSPGIADAYEALQAGKLDQAESRYRAVLQADAQNVDALLGLATIALRRGNAQQAIGFYEQALQIEPRNTVAQAGMIDIIGQADPQMSETHLKQLIAREPSAFLYFSLGNLYARQSAWPTAQAAYFQAYNLQPDNPDYAYNLAIGLEHLEQPKLALTYYRKALELSFQKGHANFDQTRVIERIGQLAARVD